MGVVYTLPQIKAQQVPLPEDFEWVLRALQHEFTVFPEILGAVVCGSVKRGDFDLRSDLDCFVLYAVGYELEVFARLQELSKLAAGKNVSLSFIPCDSTLSATRMHHVGPSFLAHLERSAHDGVWVKGDVSQFAVPNVPTKQELEWYVRVKMYTLQEGYAAVSTYSEERLVGYLRKLLEAPLHVARKMLAYQGVLTEDSKAFVRTKYCEHMPTELSDQLEVLLSLDAEYTAELLRQLDSPNDKLYRNFLAYVAGEAPTTLEFIRSNLLFMEANSEAR